MRATDILSEEHRVILKVLECMDAIAEEAERTGKLNKDAATAAVDFFRNFADGCHHAKEEDRLFVVMQENGIPREGGPIGVMLMEHDDGRHLVRNMAQSLEKAGEGDKEAIASFARNARDFKALLTAHIQKEDQVLFPMAGQVLNDTTAETLLADFKRIEAEAGGKRHAEYLEVARKLCEAYDIPFLNSDQIPTITAEFNPN